MYVEEDGGMKAIQVNEFGGPETMRLADVPGPEIGDDEMLIDVAAASVNRVDILLRSGKCGGGKDPGPHRPVVPPSRGTRRTPISGGPAQPRQGSAHP